MSSCGGMIIWQCSPWWGHSAAASTNQPGNTKMLTRKRSDSSIYSPNHHNRRYVGLTFLDVPDSVRLMLTGRTILGVKAGLGRHAVELSSDQARTIGIVRSSIDPSFSGFTCQWWVPLSLDGFRSSNRLRDSICHGQYTNRDTLHPHIPREGIAQGLLDCWHLQPGMGSHQPDCFVNAMHSDSAFLVPDYQGPLHQSKQFLRRCDRHRYPQHPHHLLHSGAGSLEITNLDVTKVVACSRIYHWYTVSPRPPPASDQTRTKTLMARYDC